MTMNNARVCHTERLLSAFAFESVVVVSPTVVPPTVVSENHNLRRARDARDRIVA